MDGGGQRWTCSSGQSDFGCSVDADGLGILCVDQRRCPSAEERRMIHFTVYVRTKDFLVESYSKYFYLSQIGETSLGSFLFFLFGAQFVVFSVRSPSFFSFFLFFFFVRPR